MLPTLIADFAYLLTALVEALVLLLILEWLLHFVPGWQLNPLRRFLFKTAYPLLAWGRTTLPFKMGFLDATPLLLALLLLAAVHFGIPWLVVLSFTLRG